LVKGTASGTATLRRAAFPFPAFFCRT